MPSIKVPRCSSVNMVTSLRTVSRVHDDQNEKPERCVLGASYCQWDSVSVVATGNSSPNLGSC